MKVLPLYISNESFMLSIICVFNGRLSIIIALHTCKCEHGRANESEYFLFCELVTYVDVGRAHCACAALSQRAPVLLLLLIYSVLRDSRCRG